jgi:transposase
MASRRTLTLSEAEKHELEAVAAHAAKPYQRERAAALLKIASGQSPHAVAQHGLLIARDPDTVYAWLKRYETERQAKQQVGKGRGRKPAFSPSVPG